MTQVPDDVLRVIGAEHVDALVAGANLLGSGGGGDPAIGAPFLRQVLNDPGFAGPVPVVGAEDLPPDALVVHAGVAGAPDVHSERLIDPVDCARAVEAVVSQVGGQLAAVGVIEIGGINAVIGVLAAAQLGVPVVDGDLMGRAFPRLDQATLTVAGYPISPMAVVGPLGDTVVVTQSSFRVAQRLMVSSAGAFGGAAAVALLPVEASALVNHGVRRSLSTCVRSGEALLQVEDDAPAASVAQRVGARLLCEGRVDQLRPRSEDAPGSITLTDRLSGAVVRVDHLEEFLVVAMDGETLVHTPDVIAALDLRVRRPMRTDEVRLGQSLAVMTFSALYAWSEEALAAVGPAGFGLKIDGTGP